MESLLAPLAGMLASGLCFWLMSRSSRKKWKEVFDEIERGPKIIMTLHPDGRVTTRHVPRKSKTDC